VGQNKQRWSLLALRTAREVRMIGTGDMLLFAHKIEEVERE